MSSLLIAFLTSFFVTILIIRSQHLHLSFSADHNLIGPQKFHQLVVPRVGGIGIFLGASIALTVRFQFQDIATDKIILIACSLPVFLIGLLEDCTKKIGVRMRLIFTALSAFLACYYLNIQITRLDIPGIDLALSLSPVAMLFSIFAITGLSNAYNIIDGFNGLSSMVGMITLIAIGYIGHTLQDSLIMYLSFSMVAAILGFFIWNYPKGLIFLGDGGAYFMGFWIAILSILTVTRHANVSPWFALLINAYPIWETLFSIYRRIFHQGKSVGHPDGIHLHSLLFRRVLNRSVIKNESDWFNANARTSPYLWMLSSLAVISAVLFWESTPILIGAFILFAITYVWLYKKIVCFQTPNWMHIK